MTGGVLFLVSALLSGGMASMQALLPGLPFDISRVLFWVGAIIFAIGLGRAGSVTARRPLGTGAIIALAAWTLIVAPVAWILVVSEQPTMAVEGGYPTTVAVMGTAEQVVSLLLAIIAVVQIGRAAIVSNPWNWAPLWALLAVVVAQLIPNLVATVGAITDQSLLAALFAVIGIVSSGAVAFLGVTAIVLAVRTASGEMVVYTTRR